MKRTMILPIDDDRTEYVVVTGHRNSVDDSGHTTSDQIWEMELDTPPESELTRALDILTDWAEDTQTLFPSTSLRRYVALVRAAAGLDDGGGE